MCEYCENMRVSRCKVRLEYKKTCTTFCGMEMVPTFVEKYIPLNYCPQCGRNIRKEKKI